MASCDLKPGVPVILRELEQSSEMFKQGASLRVTGNLQSYDVNSATAVIQAGSVSLKVDTQHLRDVSVRTNSMYQFIGELMIRPDNDATGTHRKERRWPRSRPLPAVVTPPTAIRSQSAELKESMI